MAILVPKIGYNSNSEQQGPSCAHFKFSGSNLLLKSKLFFWGYNKMNFTGNDGTSIEEFISFLKKKYTSLWTFGLCFLLQYDAPKLWELFNHDKIKALSD